MTNNQNTINDNKKFIASFSDNEAQYFCYILKTNKNTYHLLLSGKELSCCMDEINNCMKATSNGLHDITDKFIERIDHVMYKLPPPFHIKIASTYILKVIKDNFLISNLVYKNLGDCFTKESNCEFELDFGDPGDSNSDSDQFDIMDELKR